MSAPKQLQELIDQFERNEETYRSSTFNETQTRIQFLNPLFELLGWDVNNRAGHAEAYKDVVHEDALKVGVQTKAPDYSFRVGGTRKFFLEAKKPSLLIRESADSAFQLRRYAWSAKLPLSIVSNFAEFSVYDCRIRPAKLDKASTARIHYFTYDEYKTKWDEISSIFSKDAIYSGSFDKFAFTNKAKRGTAEVDAAFLDEIESWRESLARMIALRNPTLNERQVNFSVQQTIDRIVFLRIAEDRGIERYGQLLALTNGPGIYSRLCALFRNADERYNSGLFHFVPERGRDHPADELTPTLTIDDKPLKEILAELYYPESPYEFSVLPSDILGQVYEQFLGKVIRLTESGRAQIDEKPEVRKAGGVYYTPTYIVNYIISRAVEPLLDEKDPRQIERFRVLDPACGSGSFLLGAYEFMMRWYLGRYIGDDPEKHARGRPPRVFRGPTGDWQLTTSERKRILLTHIFGVDIDLQAVEVTKLSLLLKVLEGESSEQMGRSFEMFHERALPDLDDNIKCGNSLVGSDFFDYNKRSNEEIRFRINPFDWASEFPMIFKDGGFDAVIGNPPYVDSEWMTRTNPELREYCTAHYEVAKGNWDIFCVFVEKAIELCKASGRSSLIVPNKFLSADYAQAIRDYVKNEATLISVRDYSKVKVFPVSVYPVVYVAANKTSRSGDVVKYEVMRQDDPEITVASITEIPFSKLKTEPNWSSAGHGEDGALIQAIAKRGAPLETVAVVNGAATVSEAYDIQPLIHDWEKSISTYLRFVNTGTLDRYSNLWAHSPTRYLKKTYLKPIVPASNWPRLPKKRLQEAQAEKIVVGGMTKVLECAFDDGSSLAGKSTSIVLKKSVSLQYILPILNSKLMSFYFRKRFAGLTLEGGYLRIGPPQLRLLPIPVPDRFPEISLQLEKLAVEMTRRNAECLQAKTTHERTVIERQISSLDTKIDNLVYKLFALDPMEIAAIEGESC